MGQTISRLMIVRSRKPSILIAGAGACDMTRFIVAVVSVTQVLYLSEVGGLILGSKLPLNIWELFVIFLERTVISLLIVCPSRTFCSKKNAQEKA